MTGNNTADDEWDDVSFVISSTYREAALTRLAASPATPSQIAADRQMDISHTSRALGELRERGLVELLVPEERKKGRIYGLTDRGSDIAALVEEQGIGHAE
jgi:DNA-binding MarR family transcriptional regulator